MSANKHYLSVVIPFRKNYRLELLHDFVQHFILQAEKHSLSSELLILTIDFNNTDNLVEGLSPFKNSSLVTLRHLNLPKEAIGERTPLAAETMIKNAAIKVSAGDFILCTDIHVTFSDQLIHFMAKRSLSQNLVYSAYIALVPQNINIFESSQAEMREEIIKWLPDWTSRYPGLSKMLENKRYHFKLIEFVDVIISFYWKAASNKDLVALYNIHKEQAGNFILMSKKAWYEINGFLEMDIFPNHAAALALINAHAKGFTQKLFAPHQCIYLKDNVDSRDSWLEVLDQNKEAFEHMINSIGTSMLVKKLNFDEFSKKWGDADKKIIEVSL